RIFVFPLIGLSIMVAAYCLFKGVDAPMVIQAGGLISAFFFGSLVCHGELACIKPHAKYLTLYYLALSLGGALGGVFVVICSPMLFTAYFELHVGFILAIGLAAIAFHARTDHYWFRKVPYGVSVVVFGVLAIGLSTPLVLHVRKVTSQDDGNESQIEFKVRDFWGVLAVKRSGSDATNDEKLQLVNGRINHGNQYVNEKWRLYPTTYYCKGSGIALAIQRHPRRLKQESLRIAVIGLGTGTVAAWGEAGDLIRFYEINPEVKRVAEENFYYLSESRLKNNTEVDVVLGDARIQMQRQLKAGKKQNFDVIAVDAFSSDAIPRHLLTLESVELYQNHLRDPSKGIIAIHISNRFLDLEGICHRIGKELGYQPLLIECNPDPDELHWGYDNTWVLFTKNRAVLDDVEIKDAKWRWEIDWTRTDLEDLILVETGETIDLSAEPNYDFPSLADVYANSGVNRLAILEEQLKKAALPGNSDSDRKEARMELQKFVNQEAGQTITLTPDTPFDSSVFEQPIQSSRRETIFEMKAKWEKAKRQFNVLWTDDFGSLWQVIRLKFDWKESRDELLDWLGGWGE
ncbi:MAG: fused MFS/spermidine synthase, partial [Planctomycetota bacterium]|nr:fused MFS/spermidine synthase [Planctomycetota bacterium]